jgi:sortase A
LTFSRTALERSLFVTGVTLCIVYLGTIAYREAGSRLAVRSFQMAKGTGEAELAKAGAVGWQGMAVDYRLWSAKRIAAYEDTLARQFAPPLAVLRVPRLDIEVPVFDGTGELILNRGVGRIDGTAQPGQPGNMGIAGHRDGFFRGLKDIAVGDSLTLETGEETSTYEVSGITIVDPTDVSVLAETATPALTLVTCYPFYFVGDAPQRYIVRCSLKERLRRNSSVLEATTIRTREETK